MTYILSQPEILQNISTKKRSFISRLFQWTADEDHEHHIGWVGGNVTAMTTVFFPVTMASVLVNGAALIFLIQ